MNGGSVPRAVALLGGSGHARSVADVLERLGIEVHLVIAPDVDPSWGQVARDDEEGLALAHSLGLPVVLAVGGNGLRARLEALVSRFGLQAPAIVATTATCAPSAQVDRATVVMEHAHVGPAARLGPAVIVNTHATVEHDVRVGAAGHIAPGAILGGGVTVGEKALVGTGAVVLPGVSIGDAATVGAGAVVREDVPADATVVGVPARRISSR